MKIGYLLPNLHLTGGSRVAVEIGKRLSAIGWDFYIIIPKGRNRMADDETGIKVVECGAPAQNPLLAVLTGSLGMYFKIPEVDALVASMPVYALLGRIIGNRRNIPAVNYVLNDDVHFFDDGSYLKSPFLRAVYRFLARKSIKTDFLIANSHWTATRCVTEGGDKPFAIVPSGYDPDYFYQTEPKKNLNNPVRFVTVGRIALWKGFADLIEALNLIDINKRPFVLRVITQDNLDATKAAFPVEMVKPKNDRELADFYRWGDVFLHSSWFEGFGLPPLEAQACGLPIVATNSRGIGEFLKDGFNAAFAPPRDPRSMADKIEWLIDRNETRLRFIENGLKSCRRFTWDNVADKFEKTLIEIVNGFRS